MLRGDNIICGTSSTGTTTPLVLTATPVPPGGVDFDVFARTTGIGWPNSKSGIVSYTIIEYTDNTYATAKQHEKGVGTLNLGSSSGIANATLSRTTVQTTATSLNAQPATQVIGTTPITIVTAANCLVFIGPSATDLLAFPPYVDATTGTGYAVPLGVGLASAAGVTGLLATSGNDYYTPFLWATPMLVKKIYLEVITGTGGGTSSLYARIYQVSALGQPGKLLYDFGLVGGANGLNASATPVVSGAGGSGYFLMPGPYFLNLWSTYTGGGTPVLYGNASWIIPSLIGGDAGSAAFGNPIRNVGTATGGTSTASDPANTASYATSLDATNRTVSFGLRAS